MRFLVFSIFFIGCSRLGSAEYYGGRLNRRNAPFDERIPDNWFNVDEELAGSHMDLDTTPNHFSLDLHMDFPQKQQQRGSEAPIVKNPMWIDKLAIIKPPPPMCPYRDEDENDAEDYDPIPIMYRMPSSKSRQKRSTQQANKKTTRQLEKKSKFKTWLEGKMDKKLGEKFAEKFSKLKKPTSNRQTRSVDKNDVTTGATEQSSDEKENRINRQSNCAICSGLNRACPFCNSPLLYTSVNHHALHHQPRPQFIEFINGEPMAFVPGAQHTSAYLGATPRYVYDQLGHKYMERDGNLQILPPQAAVVESSIVAIPYRMPYSADYSQMLYDTLQRHPHFQTQHLEDGQLTDSPIKQTQDVIEFIRALTQQATKDKSHQKRQAAEDYNMRKDIIEETIVDEDALSSIFLEQDEEFEKYLQQIGYTGNVEMFDVPDSNQSPSQSIFYSSPKGNANNFFGHPAKKSQKPFVNFFKPSVTVE